MVLLMRDGETSQGYLALDDAAPPPADGPFTVSVGRFLAEHTTLAAAPKLGVHVDPDEDVETLKPLFATIDLVVLRFSKMADGRPLSLARTLRKRLGYQGQLIAHGPLIADQFSHLERCGFDGVEVGADVDVHVWTQALRRHRQRYQPDPGRDNPAAVTVAD